jgi:hypothetical protein
MLRAQRDRFVKLWWTGGVDFKPKRRRPMSLSSHIEELKKKHITLSEQVEAAQRAPGTSTLEIAELKKQKLRLKEEIERLSVTA